MVPAYDTFVAALRESLYANATALAQSELEILPSTHGDRAGVVGCAQLALTRVLAPESIDRMLVATAGHRPPAPVGVFGAAATRRR